MDSVQKQIILQRYSNNLVSMDGVIEELQAIAPNLLLDPDFDSNKFKRRKTEK